MSQRLPTPGGDNGTWGDILNAFLEVSLASDGTLNSNVVGTNQIQNNVVTNTKLDSPTQTTLASVAGKYTKPGSGIPSTDLDSYSQTALANADTAVQSVNNVTPTSGNVTITAGSINAVATSQLGAASGVATLDSGTHLTASQLPSSVGTVIPFAYQGALAVVTGATKVPVPVNGTITAVRAAVGTAPTGASIILDLKKNGTTTFTTSANRPTISTGGTSSTTTLPDVTSAAAGDLLSVDVNQTGSIIPGSDLTLIIYIHPS